MFALFKNWIHRNRSALTLWLGIALLYSGFFAVGITCPIKYLTGVSCAGCGMTRAWVHALTFRFAEAFEYNPVFWIVPFLAFFCFLLKRKPRTAHIGLVVCLTIMLIAYGIRMADPTDSIVVFAPQESSVYRISHAVIAQIKAWLRL